MQSEVWDILDECGRPTGRTTLRGNYVFKKGEYHLVVHIWIVSSAGEYLIQRRSEEKKLMPGEWAATGGAAKSGETSFVAASRELFEELGIESDEQSLKFLRRIKRHNSFLDIWVIKTDVPAEELTLQESEVSAAKWVSEKTLKQMIRTDKYHNYGKEYFSAVLGGIKDLRGNI